MAEPTIEYIRRLADLMRLRDWTIELDPPLADDDSRAGHVVVIYGRKLAQIALRPTQDAAELRHTIVHELVHCHFEPACAMVHTDLEEVLGKAADQVFWHAFRRSAEYAVDGLADAIAPLMPYPPAGTADVAAS
jgi:hypothetical protein